MRRTLLSGMGALLLTAAALAGTGSTAIAAPVSIQAGTLYVYEHDDYAGGVASFTSTDSDLSNNSWSGSPGRIINNNISSMKNRSDRDVIFYNTGGSCSGDAYLARKDSVDSDLTNNSFDNKASCLKFG